MYEQFFGLSEKPFSIQPDPSFLYWGRTHRLAYAMLEYGVLNHAGISVITGEIGCGKTTLIHRLLDQLSGTHTVALLSNIQQGRGDLLSWVLMGFGEPFAGKTHVELFSQLQNFFIAEYSKGRRVVLVIDEAQNLSTDMLEELRMLSNINAGKDQLLQLILAGQPELKGLLNKPELVQLAQRIGADFHLTPLNRDEVHAYIETRLSIAGCQRRIFTDRAMDYIAEQSKGVPRVINIIADTALVYAFSAEELVVGVETIRNVVKDKLEFGVFGLASDQNAAAPLKSVEPSGIDAFADPPAPANPASGSSTDQSRNEPEKPNAGFAGDETENKIKAPKKSRAAPMREVEQATTVEAQTIVQTAGQQLNIASQQAQKTETREESSITGVVVISADASSLPEAAIRSAGDGRAIVFACPSGNAEAIAIAQKAGAVVAETGDARSLTKGRLRNAGYRQLKKIAPHLEYVQFLEADQALAPDWVARGEKFMGRRPEVVLLEGGAVTARQLTTASAAPNPDADEELANASLSAALVRADAFETIGGFRGDIVAADMVDLSVRLRRRGGRIWRSSEAMTIISSPQKGFGPWWRRKMKRGFENAVAVSLHGGPPDRIGVGELTGAVFWGGLYFPLLFIFSAIAVFLSLQIMPDLSPYVLAGGFLLAGLAGALGFILLAAAKSPCSGLSALSDGFARLMGKTPEFLGVCQRLFSRKA
ncbi:MAG: AAA family ATPase [Pseudomonadota bacterium]